MPLLKSSRRVRVVRPLCMKQARPVITDRAWIWGDRVFRKVALATGDLELAASTANKVYWKIVEQKGKSNAICSD